MVDAGRPFEEIHDLIGIRIITKRVGDCYAALGLVHTHWPPVQGRFKDYIAMPKFNLYQSLHTTVLGPDRKPIEVQIRTEEMHERAERGIAAHWVYKEGTAPEDVEGVRSINALPREYENPEEFLANLKLDLYQDEVFVLTPKGEVKSLPRGATPVDLAYAVHTEVGHRCTGARVNGRLVPLNTRLESGDIVEILTSRVRGPRPEPRLAQLRAHDPGGGQDPPMVPAANGATWRWPRGGSRWPACSAAKGWGCPPLPGTTP